MSMHRITHIRKPNRDSSVQHITHVAYDGVIHLRSEVIRLITSGSASFYVAQGGERSDVRVIRPTGRDPYIRTAPDADGEKRDNLLSLPEC